MRPLVRAAVAEAAAEKGVKPGLPFQELVVLTNSASMPCVASQG